MADLTNAEKRTLFIEAIAGAGSASQKAPLGRGVLLCEIEAEALRRYPDPKTYKLSNLGECRYHNDTIEVRDLGAKDWHPVSRPTEDYLAFAKAITDATPPVAKPIPDPYEPTIVTEAHGFEWRIVESGDVEYRGNGTWTIHPTFTASTFASFGEISHEYYEYVRAVFARGYAKARALSIAMGASDASLEAEAMRMAHREYPDPPQPREIILSNGLRCRMDKDTVMAWAKDAYGVMRWQVCTVCLDKYMRPVDLRALADLKENPRG